MTKLKNLGWLLQPEEEIIPADDAAGLAAFLHLLACVLRNAEAGEMEERVRQLEGIAGVAPLWELLFQLMCFPVPQVSPQNLLDSVTSYRYQSCCCGCNRTKRLPC